MAKEDEIESLAKLGRSLLVLPSGEVSHSTNVSDTISRLNHDHSALSQQVRGTDHHRSASLLERICPDTYM